MAMHPRVMNKTIELLESGRQVSKHDIAEIVHCCHRAALDALRHIRTIRDDVRIVDWQPIYHQKVPVYAISSKPDVPKPAPLTEKERMKKYRMDHPERREREAAKKRVRRQAAKLGINPAHITIHRMGA